jgi:predicted RNase H-like HicB family nuclease
VRQAILYPGEDNYWVAEVPSLPGCISQGATREEAAASIREAIELHLEALDAHGIEN